MEIDISLIDDQKYFEMIDQINDNDDLIEIDEIKKRESKIKQMNYLNLANIDKNSQILDTGKN